MSPGTRALAGLWWRDGLRAWRVLLVRAVVPVLLLTIVGVATLLRGEDRSESRETLTIATAGDIDVVRERTDPLVRDRLVFVASDDPALDTAFGADAGIRVPDGAAAALARGDDVEVELFVRVTDSGSRAASSLLGIGLSGIDLQQVRVSVPDAAVGDTTFEVVDVQRTREGAQSLYAQVAAALLALHASMLVGAAGSRLAGRRHAAQSVAIMLLPISRRSLVHALTLSETGLGLVSSIPVLVPTALGAVAFTLLESGWRTVPVTVVAVAAASLVLCTSMVALGTAIGLRVASSEQVSLLSSIAVVGMAAIAGVVSLGESRPPAAIAVIPVAGVIDALRGALTDGDAASLAWLVVACASTVAATALVMRAAARTSDDRPLGVRAS